MRCIVRRNCLVVLNGAGMAIGERVREARRMRNISMAALARATHLSKGFISQVESGSSTPSLGSLGRLADALQVPLASLLGDESLHSYGAAEGEVVTRPWPQRDAATVTIVSESRSWLVVAATVPPRKTIQGAGIAGESITCTVIRGEVSLAGANAVTRLNEGTTSTWSGDGEYLLANIGSSSAMLMLVLPKSAGLPALVETAPPAQNERTPHKVESVQGPLRLVAMRAARLQERRG
jgi:transcriptional regulator with XRE-family HTH domain